MDTTPSFSESDDSLPKGKSSKSKAKVDQELQREEASTLDAILIQLTRNYDATMMLLKHFDAAEAQWLADYHEQGGILSPNPAIYVENDAAAVLGTSGDLDGPEGD